MTTNTKKFFALTSVPVLAVLCFGAAGAPTYADGQVKGSFIPGISIVPSVFEPNGTTLRTYQSGGALSYWTPKDPVAQGDKLSLNIVVATGGADLAKIIVRLDNQKIVDKSSSPWTAVIDTQSLNPGAHMVEVWAEATGNPPKANTQTFTFFVSNPLPTSSTLMLPHRRDAEGPIDMSGPIGAGNPASETVPDLSILENKPIDADALVALHTENPRIDSELAGTDLIRIDMPTEIYCEPTPGSDAVAYGYALVRDGKTIWQSDTPASLKTIHLQIEPRTAQGQGLFPGSVSLWVWGIDRNGNPSNPIHRDLQISSEGS